MFLSISGFKILPFNGQIVRGFLSRGSVAIATFSGKLDGSRFRRGL